MNKNAVYLAIFGVLCVLTGVAVGAGIARKADLSYFNRKRPSFVKKAERFMWHRPKGLRSKLKRGKNGLFAMLADELNLDQDQRIKVKEILEQARQEIDKAGEGLRSAITEIKEKSDKQIMSQLNPQQQEKFRKILEEFKKRHQRMRSKSGRGPIPEFGPKPLPRN